MDANNMIDVVFITGMSGSGKSVALNALEDSGYFCVDNLPPELIKALIDLEIGRQTEKLAVAIDVRSARALPGLPFVLADLKNRGIPFKLLFLDASTDVLLHRFSETRRSHPLSKQGKDLLQAIELERTLLADIRDQGHLIDSSLIKNAQLMAQVKTVVHAVVQSKHGLSLMFESFAFKRGVPLDADFVFDVRMLPNPHYEPALKELTGKDEAVMAFLKMQNEVADMQAHIQHFLERWLPTMARDQRSYVTVAIGCTGGQHRSVYLVEQLALSFKRQWSTLTRHRELGLA